MFKPYEEMYVRREADCLALTNHPNIVKFISLEESDEFKHILVMELLSDKTLADRASPNGLESSDFLRLCHQLCAAVAGCPYVAG